MTYTTFLDQSQSKVVKISKYLFITKSQITSIRWP